MQITHFGQTLNALIEKNHGSQRQFAKLCSVDQATVHHAINGRAPSRELLSLFCLHIGADESDRLALLQAHLADEAAACAAAGVDISRLVIRTSGVPALAEQELPPDLRQALALIAAEACAHEDMRDLVRSWGAMLERHRALPVLADEISSADPVASLVPPRPRKEAPAATPGADRNAPKIRPVARGRAART